MEENTRAAVSFCIAKKTTPSSNGLSSSLSSYLDSGTLALQWPALKAGPTHCVKEVAVLFLQTLAGRRQLQDKLPISYERYDTKMFSLWYAGTGDQPPIYLWVILIATCHCGLLFSYYYRLNCTAPTNLLFWLSLSPLILWKSKCRIML